MIFQKNKIKTVVFDLDDTLIPSSQFYHDSYLLCGIDSQGENFKTAKELVKKSLGNNHTSSHNRILYFKKYLELENNFTSKNLISLVTKYNFYLKLLIKDFIEKSKRNLLFRQLKEKYTLAIITNETTLSQIIKLEEIDSNGEFFSNIITSEEIGVEKPSDEIYQYFFKTCQTLPENCLFVGDNFTTDLQKPILLGASTILTQEFNNENDDYQINCTKIKSLEELKEVL
ncbi:HAD family hydrolase [Pigmentibacter sp. JX0631]|uniref:HAD family hydrolase n=1 Tax=Pigmentibacter sp. JX0631 TaxID=2976982 RepID=UPI0024693004|nr:HAD family hydrolase [Pigmentibacter sp. JX0631]WGL60803.1 HAD family hydrolase [Pigmentibacter sp. JX0631]